MSKLMVTLPQGKFVSGENYQFPQLARPAFEGAFYQAYELLEHAVTPHDIYEIVERTMAFAAACLRKACELLPEQAQTVVCIAGCADCCRHLRVSLTAPEVFMIQRFLLEPLSSLPPEAINRALHDFLAVRSTQYVEYNYHKDSGEPLVCPFLVDDHCGIYPVRPLNCRGYCSCDAEICHAYLYNPFPAHSPPVFLPQYEMVKGVSNGLQHALRMHGFQRSFRPLDFVSSLCVAMETPSAMKRWLAKEDIFAHTYVSAKSEGNAMLPCAACCR